MSFSYNLENKEDVCVYRFMGRILDKEDAKELMTDFDMHLELGTNKFLVDLNKLEYMNSSGLGILISMLTKSRNKYGELAVCCVSEKVNKLLVTSKLNNIFKIYKDEKVALEALKN